MTKLHIGHPLIYGLPPLPQKIFLAKFPLHIETAQDPATENDELVLWTDNLAHEQLQICQGAIETWKRYFGPPRKSCENRLKGIKQKALNKDDQDWLLAPKVRLEDTRNCSNALLVGFFFSLGVSSNALQAPQLTDPTGGKRGDRVASSAFPLSDIFIMVTHATANSEEDF
mgnify:CR=1 FL=1